MPARHAYVPAMTVPALVTADELLRASIPGKRVELVRGAVVVREPAGSRHGLVAMSVGVELGSYVKRTGTGAVFAAETGFRLASDPDTVRAADVAFVGRERMPPQATAGYLALSPDLVVEVLSPGDRPAEILAKVADWLAGGSRLVWVVDPERRLVRVYRSDGSETIVENDSALDGEDVLPGFSCPLSSIL